MFNIDSDILISIIVPNIYLVLNMCQCLRVLCMAYLFYLQNPKVVLKRKALLLGPLYRIRKLRLERLNNFLRVIQLTWALESGFVSLFFFYFVLIIQLCQLLSYFNYYSCQSQIEIKYLYIKKNHRGQKELTSYTNND